MGGMYTYDMILTRAVICVAKPVGILVVYYLESIKSLYISFPACTISFLHSTSKPYFCIGQLSHQNLVRLYLVLRPGGNETRTKASQGEQLDA